MALLDRRRSVVFVVVRVQSVFAIKMAITVGIAKPDCGVTSRHSSVVRLCVREFRH